MKTLICTTPGQFAYADTQVPERKQGETLLRIRRVGICGTDLHAYEGTQPFFQYPRILGHELAAEIAATDAPGFAGGEYVTIIPYFHCGNCVACKAGKTNCCAKLSVCGVHEDGGMREYMLVPSSSLVKSQGLGLDELALVEPLAIGAHGIRRAQIIPGEWVAVIGAGPIGLGVMEFARIAGANVIAVDVQENRLQFCTERLQIPFTINAAKENVSMQLAQITHGDMPTVVIDATGNLSAINESFGYMAHGGRYVLVGLQKGEIRFPHPGFHQREATLMSSRNATREDFDRVIDALQKGQVLPLNYITHRVAFAGVKEAFPDWLLPANQVIKAMITI
jgi:2-desacetyl-2-hydroxyethyl bacteriochlorophyllide A dehydrogenase